MLEQLRQSDITQVSLHMLVSNDAALRLYTAHGFSILCVIREYYDLDDGSRDAYWMRKDLTKSPHISEARIFATSIREGPWPLGLNFVTFTTLLLALFLALLLFSMSQLAKYGSNA